MAVTTAARVSATATGVPAATAMRRRGGGGVTMWCHRRARNGSPRRSGGLSRMRALAVFVVMVLAAVAMMPILVMIMEPPTAKTEADKGVDEARTIETGTIGVAGRVVGVARRVSVVWRITAAVVVGIAGIPRHRFCGCRAASEDKAEAAQRGDRADESRAAIHRHSPPVP